MALIEKVLELRQGDNPGIQFTLTDPDGGASDLTGDTVVLTLYRDGVSVFTRTSATPPQITIDSAVEGNITVNFTDAEIATLVNGAYTYEIAIVTGGAAKISVLLSAASVTGPGNIVWGEVATFAPELADLNTYAQVTIIEYVNEALNGSAWEGLATDRARLARLYLAAHLATMTARSSDDAAGPTVQKKTGELMVQYASLVTPGEALTSTFYGQAYKQLMRASPVGLPCVL